MWGRLLTCGGPRGYPVNPPGKRSSPTRETSWPHGPKRPSRFDCGDAALRSTRRWAAPHRAPSATPGLEEHHSPPAPHGRATV